MTPDWHHKTLDWNGTISTDWHNADNWSDGGSNSSFPPDASCDVTIDVAPNNVIVTGEASCGGITANGADSLRIEAEGKLNVGGN